MSTQEHDQQAESRSKIKLVRNAKGDPQWEISVLAGETKEVLDAMRQRAVEQWEALERDLGIGFPSPAVLS